MIEWGQLEKKLRVITNRRNLLLFFTICDMIRISCLTLSKFDTETLQPGKLLESQKRHMDTKETAIASTTWYNYRRFAWINLVICSIASSPFSK